MARPYYHSSDGKNYPINLLVTPSEFKLIKIVILEADATSIAFELDDSYKSVVLISNTVMCNVTTGSAAKDWWITANDTKYVQSKAFNAKLYGTDYPSKIESIAFLVCGEYAMSIAKSDYTASPLSNVNDIGADGISSFYMHVGGGTFASGSKLLIYAK